MSGYWIIFIIPVGLIVGSLLKVYIVSLPKSASLFRTFYQCPHCKGDLLLWQIIPLFRIFVFKAKCHFCQQSIRSGYPVVEFVCVLTALVLFLKVETLTSYLFYLFLFWGIILASAVDLLHRIIPNRLITLLVVGGGIFNFCFVVNKWSQALLGLILSIMVMLSLRSTVSFFLKKESLGMGDVKFSGVLGFYLGIENFLFALCIGSFLGILYAYTRKNLLTGAWDRQIPFVPFLSSGVLLTFFFQSELRSYLMV